jgi:choline dehydrogenase-like flavoprotein
VATDAPNLFVSDSSVRTAAGAANSTRTIVALMLWLADHMRSRTRWGGCVDGMPGLRTWRRRRIRPSEKHRGS